MKKGIYHLGQDAYELAVTPKHTRKIWLCCTYFASCFITMQEYVEMFVDHNWFQRFILSCILTNTFSMGIEFHNQPEILTKTVEISNLVFSIIFAVEMLLKLIAYGFFRYISDGFNVFDGLIVMLRYKSSRPLGLLNSFSALYYLLFQKVKMTHFWSKMTRTGKLALVLSYRINSF